ncbi:hypothetical protein DFH29DRAFT_871634 [Suillus ampliporus]|nr:hypothetical protein DFH29DRAFT_871634 [Suillus ampliporus]
MWTGSESELYQYLSPYTYMIRVWAHLSVTRVLDPSRNTVYITSPYVGASEVATQRQAAADVLQALVSSGYQTEATEIVGSWITSGLQQYNLNPTQNWKMGPPISIGNNISPGPSAIVEYIYNIGIDGPTHLHQKYYPTRPTRQHQGYT